MRIGILQTGHAPDETRTTMGDYDQMFRELLDGNGFTFDTYAVLDGTFPDGPDAAEGWIITGSKHGVYEDHAWIPPLEELIRAIHAKGLPLVGICFGHQIIAQALGGKVEKFAGGWAVGRTDYDFGDEKLALNAWHQDQVVDLPEGAQVIASNDFCANAALIIGDSTMTIQPHPEFESSFVEALINHRGKGVVPQPILDAAAEKLTQPIDNGAYAARMAAFLKKGGK